jgi:hypothetical protein
MELATIQVKYTCGVCGVTRRVVSVPARTIEDVNIWMDQTVLLLMADHQRVSFGCVAREFKELMIPVTGASKIGGSCEN